MSAYVVDKAHISAILRGAMAVSQGRMHYYHNGQAHELNSSTVDQAGQMLLDECVKSVSYRYSDDAITELPGRTDAEWLVPFTAQIMGRIPEPVELLKLINCYEYQSCEHPGWHESQSHTLTQALTHHAISRLPGYDEAWWDWVA